MDSMRVGPVIDGEQVLGAAGEVFEVINPATGRVVAEEVCCDAASADRIVESADAAYHSAGWQGLAPADRGALLSKLADVVEAEAEGLIELELADTGKPVGQLRGGEIPLTAALLRFYAGAADKVEGAVKNTPGGLHLTTWEPYGVVAGILPWNYPLVNVAMKVAPALAAGNAIVVKPSVETPLTAVAFGELCVEAGIPGGIVNVLTGRGSQAGSALVAHPKVKKVSFTGSTAVGQAIQKLAADQMKSVNLECGGKNAIVVFADADLDKAADAAVFSVMVNCGQLCVSCSRLLVEAGVADDFESRLTAKLAKVTVGDPRDESTLVGPMITRSQYELVLEYLQIARDEGCRFLAGSGAPEMPGELAGGFWVVPTLLADVTPGMRVHDEEIFGPVLAIGRFGDEAEAVELANATCYGLSGSVWTRDVGTAGRMVAAMDTGIVWVNTMLAGYPQIPVPPHRMSGTGVELGTEGLLAYLKRKSAVIGTDDSAPVGWDLK